MTLCYAPDCREQARCKGLCHKHYKRLLRCGDPSATKQHGLSGTKEYLAWKTIRARCLNPSNKDYKYYGGRGISICARWVGSPEIFIQEVGKAPDKSYQIDRIDNDKGYEPGNVRWVDTFTNNRNKSNTKITFDVLEEIRKIASISLTNKDLAAVYGVSESCMGETRRKIKAGIL